MKTGISRLKMLGIAAALALPGVAFANEAPSAADEHAQQTTQDKPADKKEKPEAPKESK